MKKNNTVLVITTLLCLLPIILSLVVYRQLPEQVAVHFDNNGNPDNYLPKAFAAIGLPILIAMINVYSNFMRNKDPRGRYVSTAMNTFVTWLIPLLSVVLVPVTLFMAMGAAIPITIIIPAAMGVIIIACGNYLPKSKKNYTVGIKLPWTLHSETNWNKTHHFAGYLWVVCGIIMIAVSCLNKHSILVDSILIIVMVAVPVFYSYFMYKKEMYGSHN